MDEQMKASATLFKINNLAHMNSNNMKYFRYNGTQPNGRPSYVVMPSFYFVQNEHLKNSDQGLHSKSLITPLTLNNSSVPLQMYRNPNNEELPKTTLNNVSTEVPATINVNWVSENRGNKSTPQTKPDLIHHTFTAQTTIPSNSSATSEQRRQYLENVAKTLKSAPSNNIIVFDKSQVYAVQNNDKDPTAKCLQMNATSSSLQPPVSMMEKKLPVYYKKKTIVSCGKHPATDSLLILNNSNNVDNIQQKNVELPIVPIYRSLLSKENVVRYVDCKDLLNTTAKSKLPVISSDAAISHIQSQICRDTSQLKRDTSVGSSSINEMKSWRYSNLLYGHKDKLPDLGKNVNDLVVKNVEKTDTNSKQIDTAESENESGLKIESVFSLSENNKNLNENLQVNEENNVEKDLDRSNPVCECKLAFQETTQVEEETYVMWHPQCWVRLPDISKVLRGKSSISARNRGLLRMNPRLYNTMSCRKRYDVVRPNETYIITCNDPLQLKVKDESRHFKPCTECHNKSAWTEDCEKTCICWLCVAKRNFENCRVKITVSPTSRTKLLKHLYEMRVAQKKQKRVKYFDHEKKCRYAWLISNLEPEFIKDPDYLRKNFKLLVINNYHFLLDSENWMRVNNLVVKMSGEDPGMNVSNVESYHTQTKKGTGMKSLLKDCKCVHDISSGYSSQNDISSDTQTTSEQKIVSAVEKTSSSINNPTDNKNIEISKHAVVIKKEPIDNDDISSRSEPGNEINAGYKRPAENICQVGIGLKRIKQEPNDEIIHSNICNSTSMDNYSEFHVKSENMDNRFSDAIKIELHDTSNDQENAVLLCQTDSSSNEDDLAGLTRLDRIRKLKELLHKKQSTLEEIRNKRFIND